VGLRAALALAVGSLVLYNANTREISAWDTIPARVLPREIIQYGRLDLDRLFRNWPPAAPLPYWVQQVGPHYRSSYPITPAILAVPIYATPVLLGAANSWVVLNALSKLTASLLAALSVVFVFLTARELARELETDEASAIATAIVYAVATPTWAVSSQGLWGHAPTQLGLAMALWGLSGMQATRYRSAVGGLGAGLMVACRPSAVLGAGILAAFAIRRLGRGGLPFVAILGAVGVAVAAHNLATFGTVQGGYTELLRRACAEYASSVSFAEGLLGVLLSPSRGLFVYSPILAFPAVGLILWLARLRGGLLAYAAVVTAVGIGTISTFPVWWGGHSFGPRLLADIVPALVQGLVPIWPAVWRSRPGRWLVLTAFTVSVLVEAVGAFNYDPLLRQEWNTSTRNVDQARDRLWDWRDPQLFRLLRNGPVWPGFRTAP
jgi:hypothetical protein